MGNGWALMEKSKCSKDLSGWIVAGVNQYPLMDVWNGEMWELRRCTNGICELRGRVSCEMMTTHLNKIFLKPFTVDVERCV